MATTTTPNAVTHDVPTQDSMLSAFQQRAQQGDQPAVSKPDNQQWTPNPNDPVTHVQTSDGKEWHIHGDDLAELQKRDPGLKVIRQVQDDPMLAAFNSRKRGGLPPGSIQLRKGGPIYTDKDFELSADKPIMPQEGEDFQDTLLRAQEAGRRSAQAGTLQSEIKKEESQHLKKAPFVAAAAPVIGAGGTVGLVAGGELAGAALAPTTAESAVGTGIMDEFGNEIMKQVTKIGPSRATQLASKIGQYAAKPGMIAKFPGGALVEKLIVGDMLRRTKVLDTLLGHFGLGGSPE